MIYVAFFLAGAAAALFTVWCILAAGKRADVTEAELEAWEEHIRSMRKERER